MRELFKHDFVSFHTVLNTLKLVRASGLLRLPTTLPHQHIRDGAGNRPQQRDKLLVEMRRQGLTPRFARDSVLSTRAEKRISRTLQSHFRTAQKRQGGAEVGAEPSRVVHLQGRSRTLSTTRLTGAARADCRAAVFVKQLEIF